MDYRMHQRRLLPLIAKSYAYRFAQNQLTARMHRLQTTDEPDPQESRELEGRAAGLKAAQTWHATQAIQEAREACGGAGYMAENRLTTLKGDTDVFTNYEDQWNSRLAAAGTVVIGWAAAVAPSPALYINNTDLIHLTSAGEDLRAQITRVALAAT